MPATDIQRLGLLGSDSLAVDTTRSADSGIVAISGTPQTVTATVATLFDGTQPLIRQGWCFLEISGMTGGATLGLITITMDDGTTTVRAATIPAAATLVANQGCNILIPLFASLSDTMATIKNINAIIATATANTGNVRLVFYGSP